MIRCDLNGATSLVPVFGDEFLTRLSPSKIYEVALFKSAAAAIVDHGNWGRRITYTQGVGLLEEADEAMC